MNFNNGSLHRLLDVKHQQMISHKKNVTDLSSTGDTKLHPLQRVQQVSGSQSQAFGKSNSPGIRLNLPKSLNNLKGQLKTLNSERDHLELTISLIYKDHKHMITIGIHETTTDLYKKLSQKFAQIDEKMIDKVRHFQTHSSQKNINIDYILSLDNEPLEVFMEQRHLKLEPFFCSEINDNAMHIDDYHIIKCIGVGYSIYTILSGFSRVYLVRKKDTGQFYAMKLIDKYNILKTNKEVIINNEREVMGNLESPYLAKLYYAFETKYYLAFVVEYCAGGELFYHLRKLRRLNEDLAKQYFVQVCLAIDRLHQQGVVYRDIKPENILLDLKGYIHLSDFGLAKPNMGREDTAYSFCGSPEYMSPEMLLRDGHNFMVDIYCLGALLYEFVVGSPPFYSRNIDHIYKSILNERINFPPQLNISKELKDLISKLLEKDPNHRLGGIEGVKDIFKHPWLAKFDFKALANRKLKINYKPYPLTYNFDEVEFSKGDLEFQNKLRDNLHRERILKFEKYFIGFEFACPPIPDCRKQWAQCLKSKPISKVKTPKNTVLTINSIETLKKAFFSSQKSAPSFIASPTNLQSVRGTSNIQSIQSFRPMSCTKRFTTEIDLRQN